MDAFKYSDTQIEKWFAKNNRKKLTVSQWLSPNCLLISFFISLSKVDIDIQKKFITNTIIPWEQWDQKWFFVRKFVPWQKSEEFEFVTIHDINNNLPPKEKLIDAISGRQDSNFNYTDYYKSGNMYWSLFMRLIELVRNKKKGWTLFPMWIIDYLQKCEIKWSIFAIRWWEIVESNYEKFSKIPQKWIWRIFLMTVNQVTICT